MYHIWWRFSKACVCMRVCMYTYIHLPFCLPPLLCVRRPSLTSRALRSVRKKRIVRLSFRDDARPNATVVCTPQLR